MTGMSAEMHRTMCTDRHIRDALALHKPCRQIYTPSWQLEKIYSPGVLLYNWAEERHKVGLPTPPCHRALILAYRRRLLFFLGQRTNSFPYLPSRPVPSQLFPFLSSPLLSPPLPLEISPLNTTRGLGRSTVSFPSGVWGEAPAYKRFGAYWSQKVQLWWQQFLAAAPYESFSPSAVATIALWTSAPMVT